jgi:ABC-type uncharacterized transport system ATPase subunit
VKGSFSKNFNRAALRWRQRVLGNKSLVAKIVTHADEMEIELAENADAQTLLKRLIEHGASISKFEQIEPSLNDIFIEKITGNQ